MANRFYVNRPLGVGETVVDGAEAHHLSHVCRVNPGDLICLFNGDGREYPARVKAVVRREVVAEVLSAEAPPREVGHRLDIAAPLPKGDRAQFLVEKLTELGATAFIPLHTARSVVHPRVPRNRNRSDAPQRMSKSDPPGSRACQPSRSSSGSSCSSCGHPTQR